MTIPALDFRIFGNGHGFGAPLWDQAFYWLSGDFYSFMGGLGAQLHSVQWTHPKAQETRVLCGVEFRPFSSRRSWGRVMVAWHATLPRDLRDANEWIRQFRQHLQCPNDTFRFRPAPVDRNPEGGDSAAAPSRSDESAVPQGGAQ